MELKVPLEKLQVDFDTSVRMSDPITFFQGRDTFATTKGGSPRNLAKLRGYDLSMDSETLQEDLRNLYKELLVMESYHQHLIMRYPGELPSQHRTSVEAGLLQAINR